MMIKNGALSKNGNGAGSLSNIPCPFTCLLIIAVSSIMVSCTTTSGNLRHNTEVNADDSRLGPDGTATPPGSMNETVVAYGKELIQNTAHYLGPKGTVAMLTNGMNCQNCHLDAGRRLYANSYYRVAATYPRFNARSGTAETIERKVNDCMERSLNGKKLDTAGKEMQAIVAYIQSVGNDAAQISTQAAGGTQQLVFLERAANPANGNLLYHQKCFQCHGQNGEGLPSSDSSTYIYPPVWGFHSYNVSAGIFKLSKLAGFIKNNMPYGATYEAPQLTAEEAWDIAAFINTQPRDAKKFAADWPDLTKKPIDYPFGPYSDPFSEKQHKYGPYNSITASREKKEKK